MLASLAGVAFVWRGLGTFIEKRSQFLTTFSAGVFAVLTFTLIRETFHLANNWAIALGSIALGIVVIEVVTRVIPDGHHHHSLPPDCGEKHSHIDAKRVLWSDAFHNVGDGILLAGAFAVDIRVGFAAMIGIFLHEIVQEIAEFFILRDAGYSTWRALAYNFLVSSTILIGVFLGIAASSVEYLIMPLIGFATGGFLYVLIRDLIPHTLKHANRNHTHKIHLLIFVFGMITMILVGLLAENFYAHEHGDDHTSTEEDGHHDGHDKHETHSVGNPGHGSGNSGG